MDTPKSVVPGSEWGELLVSGGLALPTTLKRHQQQGGLSETLASLTSLLALQHLGNKANESLKQEALRKLPGHVIYKLIRIFPLNENVSLCSDTNYIVV